MSRFSDSRQFANLLADVGVENRLNASERPSDVYGPCWCKSGKKWKFCHKIRHTEKKPTFGEMLSLIKTAQDKWVRSSHICLHPQASASTCSPKVISSHTVQRNGGLSAIAENGHVMSTKKGFLDIEKNDGEIVPTRSGLKEASTFPGFCNKHDTSMFLPAEGPDAALNEKSAFLLSYRALAYEYVMKQFNMAGHPVQRDNADRGAAYFQQFILQNFIDGFAEATKVAIEDIEHWKAKYDGAYNTQDFSGFNAYMVEFDSVLPFVGAGAFIPQFDFEGKTLQFLSTKTGLENLAFNITVMKGVTVAVFGWWPERSNANRQFIDSFAAIPNDEKASALATCAFEQLENVYYRESWFEGLSENERRALDELIRGGLIGKSSTSLQGRDLVLSAKVTNIVDIRRM